jgi:hypothetical protein
MTEVAQLPRFSPAAERMRPPMVTRNEGGMTCHLPSAAGEVTTGANESASDSAPGHQSRVRKRESCANAGNEFGHAHEQHHC